MTYPSRRYCRSWLTQRLLNKAAPDTLARKSHTSFAQQLVNPMALELQETARQQLRNRFDQSVSSANIKLLDSLYYLNLSPGMEFGYTESMNGERTYSPPIVYATINGVETQIVQAENNNIETLAYDCLPSRIGDAETSFAYVPVVPSTTLENLASTTPNGIFVNGHLYITIKNNYTWQKEAFNSFYYSKVYITGTTRKGTQQTEVMPIRYNGTFKTLNEWKIIDSIFVSYMDQTATITVETFPFDRESYLDSFNIFIPPEGGERMQFLRLNLPVYGSTLICEYFTISDMDIIRETGIYEKEIYYEMELRNQADTAITLNDFVVLPNTRFIYAVDDTNLYVYDIDLPSPSTIGFSESPEALIDLYSDRWMHARNDTATLKTRNRTVIKPPYKFRLGLQDPDGLTYYMDLTGTLFPTTTDAWIDNELWEQGSWREIEVSFPISKNGEYLVTLEAAYIDEDTQITETLTSMFLFFSPKIQPEIQIPLPLTLRNPEQISIDSDGQVWLYKYGNIHKLDVFHDYFLVDYERNRVWFKEDYSEVRVVL